MPDAVRAAVGGELIDRVIDTTSHATAPVADAIELIRPGGVIVVAGLKRVDVSLAGLTNEYSRRSGDTRPKGSDPIFDHPYIAEQECLSI